MNNVILSSDYFKFILTVTIPLTSHTHFTVIISIVPLASVVTAAIYFTDVDAHYFDTSTDAAAVMLQHYSLFDYGC